MNDSPCRSQRILAAALTLLALILPISIAGTNIALILATAALLARPACGQPLQWRPALIPAVWCLCLYCAVAVLTAFTGVAPMNSLHHLHKDFHKLWVFLLLLSAFRIAPRDDDTMRRFQSALFLGFAFIAAYGIFQSGFDSYRSFHGWNADGYGPAFRRARAFIHPVTYGEIAALGFLGCLSFWDRARIPRLDRRLAALPFILLAGALILNQTRGALLGVLAGFLALCVVEPSYRRWIKWGLVAIALGAAGQELIPNGRSLIASLRQFGASVGSNPQLNRLILWDVAWREFKDHPWLGVGPSNYATVFPNYFQGTIEGIRVWTSAHNIFLHQLAERGLVGLAALLALSWTLLARAWQRVRRAPDAWNLWAWSTTVAFFFMNLTETAFQTEQIATLFLFIWARAESRTDTQA